MSGAALQDMSRRDLCRRHSPAPPQPPPTDMSPQLRGLAYRHNQSISLLAMDSLLYSHFAKGLGVELDTMKGNTAVVLMNPEVCEDIYLLLRRKCVILTK